MTPELRTKIIDKLRIFLKREPKENEIVNGQTDSILMQWIAQDDAAAQAPIIESLKADVIELKKAPK